MLKTHFMRNGLYLILLLSLFTSCDDGDIIVNNFEFDSRTISLCDGIGKTKVLYKINNQDVYEAISLVANNSNFSETSNVLIQNSTSTISFELSGTNKLNFRTFDGEVPPTYFCSDIPASSPKVIEEFVSVGGLVTITTEPVTANETDTDGDNVPNNKEFNGDTDDDGIPDFRDIDDDGDNVPTKVEVANASGDPTNTDGYRDTDEDGIPNYLDKDDDDDGTDTKFEVTEADQYPTDPANQSNGLFFYLDRSRTTGLDDVTATLANQINTRYRSVISISNLKLQNQDGSGEEISFSNYDFGEYLSDPVELIIESGTTATNN